MPVARAAARSNYVWLEQSKGHRAYLASAQPKHFYLVTNPFDWAYHCGRDASAARKLDEHDDLFY